ncbi:MAG: transcription antitermination factor NusB [Cyanobacteria bacterium J06554_3]
MKARSIARELALLGISQLADKEPSKRRGDIPIEKSAAAEALSPKQIEALLLKALTTLSADAQEAIDAAEGDLERGERFLLESETRTVGDADIKSRIQPAIPLVESAINRVGGTLNLLVFVQQAKRKGMIAAQASLESAAQDVEKADELLAGHEERIVDVAVVRSQIQTAVTSAKKAITELKQTLTPEHLSTLISREDIQSYASSLLWHWMRYWKAIDTQLDDAMEKWNIRRLARVDRDILRLAMLEIVHMSVPKKVAIDEAIEMAKRYSDEDGYRFINGVLRRATDKLEADDSKEETLS